MQCNTTYYVPKVFSLAGRLKHRPSALLNKCNTKIRNTKNKSKSKTLKNEDERKAKLGKAMQTYNDTSTQRHKYTMTQIHNDTNTQ